MFPFGFGLSYTSFSYTNAKVSGSEFSDVDGVAVSVDVTNTGSLAGADVVQVYVRDEEASVQRPEKELRGFQKVRLEPGEKKTVSVHLDARAFSFWEPRVHAWVTEPGQFEILIGSSSAHIHATLGVGVVPADYPVSTLTDMSPLEDWLRDGAARSQAIGLLQELAPILGDTFGDAAAAVDDLDPHFHSYFSTMPIRGVLEFAAAAGGPDPDERLAQLAGAVKSSRRSTLEVNAEASPDPSREIPALEPTRSRHSSA